MRGGARPGRPRRADRHDGGPAGRLRDLRLLRRGRPSLGHGARRHPRGPAQARPAVRPHRPRPALRARAPTRSSCCPTTARPRAPPSSSATGTALEDLVRRALSGGTVAKVEAGDENDTAVGRAVNEATGRAGGDEDPGDDAGGGDVIVLGSGNLGLVYLMERPERLTREEIDERHPDLIPALRAHPHIGFLLVRSREHGARRPRRAGRAPPRDGPRGGRGPARAVLADGRRAPRARRRLPPTSPTSWSTASTTPSSTRVARSRS